MAVFIVWGAKGPPFRTDDYTDGTSKLLAEKAVQRAINASQS